MRIGNASYSHPCVQFTRRKEKRTFGRRSAYYAGCVHASRLLSRVENTAYMCAPRHAWHRYRRGVRLSGFSYRAISSCKFQAWQWRRRRCPIEPLERRKETYRRAIIYLRNVFIEYYAAQVGNLVHGYAINERRSERDTGRGGGEDDRGNGLK